MLMPRCVEQWMQCTSMAPGFNVSYDYDGIRQLISDWTSVIGLLVVISSDWIIVIVSCYNFLFCQLALVNTE